MFFLLFNIPCIIDISTAARSLSPFRDSLRWILMLSIPFSLSYNQYCETFASKFQRQRSSVLFLYPILLVSCHFRYAFILRFWKQRQSIMKTIGFIRIKIANVFTSVMPQALNSWYATGIALSTMDLTAIHSIRALIEFFHSTFFYDDTQTVILSLIPGPTLDFRTSIEVSGKETLWQLHLYFDAMLIF